MVRESGLAWGWGFGLDLGLPPGVSEDGELIDRRASTQQTGRQTQTEAPQFPW